MTDLTDAEIDALDRWAARQCGRDDCDCGESEVRRLIAEVRRWRAFYDRAVESGYVTADGPKEETT